LRLVLPSVLRFVQSQRETYAAEFEEEAPTRINFDLSPDHPAYLLLGTKLGPIQPRQDWYLRLPELPRFLDRIKPALERRLASSVMRNFDGELKMTFFEGGLRLVFSRGRLVEIADWRATDDGEVFRMTCFPPLVFLKLVFGYRSLDELRYAYPDCWATEGDALLLEVLFPRQPSWLRQL
jgi:hypothetical protein